MVKRKSVSIKDIMFLGIKPKFEFSKKQLAMGIKEEMEHTKRRDIAKAITFAHLKEDPNYYTKLKKAGL